MKKEVKIGIAFVVGLCLLFYGMKFLKGINLFQASNTYQVAFADVSGLNISSPVLMNGLQVGLVTQMSIDPQDEKKVLVEVTLDKAVKVYKGSKFKLDVSMLGTSSMLLEENLATKEVASSKDIFEGNKVNGMMDKVQNDMLPQVITMLPKIDSILVGMQALVNSPALQASLNNMDATTKNLQMATQSMNQMMVALNKQLPAITNNMASTTQNMSEMSSRFNRLEFEKTFSKIDSTMSNVQTLTSKFTSKDNAMGLLLNDREMYDSLKTAIGNTSGLLEDLQKNPRKYINLKVF